MKKWTVNSSEIPSPHSRQRTLVVGSVLAGLGVTLLAIAIIGLSLPG